MTDNSHYFYLLQLIVMKTSEGEINDLPNKSKLPTVPEIQEDCAFDGAMFALVPITDAAHLVHGPSGCIANFWGNRASLSSGSELYKVRFTTDMEESDIIFGGAKKLYKGILELERRYKPTAIFVYSTCVSAMIGDDIKGACLDAAEELGIPVIPVDSPGFVGSQKSGIKLAGETLLEHVIGTVEPDLSTPYDINLIGEYNIAGAIWNILPLLEKLGIRVLAKITGDARYQEVCYAHRAKLNVVISSKPLLKMAKKMQKRFGIPYIEESFYGVEDINNCLHNIAENLDNSDLIRHTQELLIEENKALDEQLAIYHQQLNGKRILLDVTNLKSLAIISVVQKLNMEVIPISTIKISQPEAEKIKRLLGDDVVNLQQDTSEGILEIIQQKQADILIANTRYRFTAFKAQIPFLDIKPELNHSYSGYKGILEAAQELYATLINPVWKQASILPPWES